MLSLVRLRAFALSPRLPVRRPHSPAGWAVAAAYGVSLVVMIGFVALHASRVPFHDEYAGFHLLFGEPSPADFWRQHNEHRIPLPRLVYVAAVKLTGYDFRAPLAVDAALLAAAAAFLLGALRQARGRFVAADAFLPLVVLGLGNADNLLWGFQVQFILSTALVLALLGLAVRPGLALSPQRMAAAGVVAGMLPLCGANGAPFGLALGAALLLLGVRYLRAAGPGLRPAGWVGVAGGLIAVGLVAASFVGLERVPRPVGTPPAFVVGVVDLLGFGFGPAAYLPHGEAHDGLTAVGVLTTLLLGATGLMLLRALRDPGRRDRALLLGAVLVGVAGLAAGVSHGRCGLPRGVFAGRYVTLFVPGLVATYLAWSLVARGAGRRSVPPVLLMAAVAAAAPNAWFVEGIARFQAGRLKRAEYEMKLGLPVGVVADRNPWLFPGEPQARRDWLETLRARGLAPFREMRPDPAYSAEPVPLRLVRAEGMSEEAGEYRVAGPQGAVLFALPRREHVHAVRLTYTAATPGGGLPRSVVSWDEGGRVPPAPGYGILDALDSHPAPAATVILIDREADTLRIDLFGAGTTMRPLGLELLRVQ